jgi:deoxyribodipyrimidine photolyase-related protein
VSTSIDNPHSAQARLIFPNQLFEDHFKASPDTLFILVEDDLFFKQFKFHKQKIMLHRLSMRQLFSTLEEKGYNVTYIETTRKRSSMETLKNRLDTLNVTDLSYYDLVDNWLQKRLTKILHTTDIHVTTLDTPGFLTTNAQLDEYFGEHPNRMQQFYIWQRKRLSILVDSKGKPKGGKWNYDINNRKKLPKNIDVPEAYPYEYTARIDEVRNWVELTYPDNPGSTEDFHYAYTHQAARKTLHAFIHHRLELFGPYEDAISTKHTQMYHSVLSPLLNTGLLTPKEVVDAVLDYASTHTIPIESLEGFLRQIIGWREYMRATYVQFGNTMRTDNRLQHSRKLSKGWWNGATGLDPVDHALTNVLRTGYAHHIERLMIFGNAMTLLRINPDDVYEWFMSMFIDAYDWVMVPNVYAMSQFAAGEMITTKPYVSGSNYILKMSDHKKGEWADSWDVLYWQFIGDNYQSFKSNPRMSMVTRIYSGFDDDKKKKMSSIAKKLLG